MGRRRVTMLLASALLVGLSGCSLVNGYDDPAAVGDWQGVTSPDNEMHVGVQGVGAAQLFYTTDNDPGTAHADVFVLSWQHITPTSFSFEMSCVDSTSLADCSPNSFTMRCNINEAEDVLDCEGDGNWADYRHDWKGP